MQRFTIHYNSSQNKREGGFIRDKQRLASPVADERLQTSRGCEKQTKSTMRNETGVLSTTIPSLLVMEVKE